MALAPVFPVNLILMLVIPVGVAAIILAVVGKRGTSVFKKQGVAWGLTLLMVFAAIGIGYAKAPTSYGPAVLEPGYSVTVPPANVPTAPSTNVPAGAASYVWDNARVLSDQTVRELDTRNERLWSRYQVSIGVVTCNYGEDDLYSYAMQCAEDMGLGGYDMIVVLDISGDNYWLLQGNDIRRNFTDNDCADYAYDYMEEWFAAGDYDFAVDQLTEMLELWYGTYYG